MSNNDTCSIPTPDYKSEYYRQEELIRNLMDENRELKDTIIGICKLLFCKGE